MKAIRRRGNEGGRVAQGKVRNEACNSGLQSKLNGFDSLSGQECA